MVMGLSAGGLGNKVANTRMQDRGKIEAGIRLGNTRKAGLHRAL